jgi:hypothetical protein
MSKENREKMHAIASLANVIRQKALYLHNIAENNEYYKPKGCIDDKIFSLDNMVIELNRLKNELKEDNWSL